MVATPTGRSTPEYPKWQFGILLSKWVKLGNNAAFRGSQNSCVIYVYCWLVFHTFYASKLWLLPCLWLLLMEEELQNTSNDSLVSFCPSGSSQRTMLHFVAASTGFVIYVFLLIGFPLLFMEEELPNKYLVWQFCTRLSKWVESGNNATFCGSQDWLRDLRLLFDWFSIHFMLENCDCCPLFIMATINGRGTPEYPQITVWYPFVNVGHGGGGGTMLHFVAAALWCMFVVDWFFVHFRL